jgi:hypothetical protein
MTQLVLHLVGDYLLQNDWMARNKKDRSLKGEAACQVHCILYSLPFLLIASPVCVFFIYLTHYLIDRFYFIRWYMNTVGQKEFAKPPTAPWSIFFVDNTFHLLSNYLIINYFNP